MTGPLSIIREIAGLFGVITDSHWGVKLFWTCVWVAFVVSVLITLYLQHNDLLAEKAKQSYPDFQAVIEEFFLEEGRTRTHLTISKVTLVLRVVNRGQASSIESYQLIVLADGKRYATRNIPTKDVLFERASHDEFGLPITDEGTAQPYEDLETTKYKRRERGDIFKGWLRYAVIGALLRREMNCELELTIVDAFGKSHVVTQRPRWSKTAKALTVIELERTP